MIIIIIIIIIIVIIIIIIIVKFQKLNFLLHMSFMFHDKHINN
jgi:hypothetical protein